MGRRSAAGWRAPHRDPAALAADGTSISLRMLRRGACDWATSKRWACARRRRPTSLHVDRDQARRRRHRRGPGRQDDAARRPARRGRRARTHPVVEDVPRSPFTGAMSCGSRRVRANVEGQGLVTSRIWSGRRCGMRPDRLCRGRAWRRSPRTPARSQHRPRGWQLHSASPTGRPTSRLVWSAGAPAGMSREAVPAQVATAISTVVHVVRRPGGRGHRIDRTAPGDQPRGRP